MAMQPEDESVLAETRRQFFGRGARGIGSIALFSLLAEQAKAETEKKAARWTAGHSTFRAQGQTRHLPAHAWALRRRSRPSITNRG